jgi:APA family basic amino acid/polyamine antiporter
MAPEPALRREVNLLLAVFVIVGVVIGSSIWLMPATALADAGPGMFLGFLLAAIPGLFVGVVCAYLGSTAPTAGGSYVVISRSISPLAGVVYLWLIALGVGSALAFMIGTFAIYLNAIPGLAVPVLVSGLGLLIASYLINILNVQISATVGLVITLLGDVLAILLFVVFGLPNIDPANLADLFPKGITPVLGAAAVFGFSYAGFTAILDVGGEIKEPRRTIPMALGLGFVILVSLYTLQALVVAGNVPWTEAADRIQSAGTFTVAEIAARFMPPAVLAAIPVMVIISIASTVHPLFLTYSRSLMLGGQDGALPRAAGAVNRRFGTPVGGLTILLISAAVLYSLMVTLSPVVEIPLQSMTDLFAALSVSTVFIGQILLSIAALRIRYTQPHRERADGFRPGNAALWAWTLGASLSSALFLVILEALAAWAALGVGYYFARRWYLARRGIRLEDALRRWPGDDPAGDEAHRAPGTAAQPVAAQD